MLTLQTGVHDEPAAARAQGAASRTGRTGSADLYLSVSPGLSRAYLDAGPAGVAPAAGVQRG